MKTITVFTLQRVLSDDWEGWYLDGTLLCEGHSVDAQEILSALSKKDGIHIEIPETIIANEKWLERRGNLPKFLTGVKEFKE